MEKDDIKRVVESYLNGKSDHAQDNFNRIESNGVSLTVNGVVAISYHSDIFYPADIMDIMCEVKAAFEEAIKPKVVFK